MITLYFKGIAIKEEDYYEISEEFKIPFDDAVNALNQIKAKGEPLYAQYSGTIRERIRKLANHISTTPETMSEPEPENSAPFPMDKEEHINDLEDSLDPLPKSEEDDIVEHAAVSLMQAMSQTETGSFIITEEGICTINRKAPPTLIQSYEVVANVLKLRNLAPRMEDKTSWMLGSIIDELEDLHGEDFEVGQVAEATDKSLNTIWTTVSVYRAFKKKRYKLSFSSHKEAFHQKIPDQSKHLILHKAEVYKLGPKPIRHLACIVKTMGDDQVIKNIRSKQQAEDLIEVHKSNKVTYLIFDDGWRRVSGSTAEIPQGKVVIDLKNWTARANNGSPIEIPKGKA